MSSLQNPGWDMQALAQLSAGRDTLCICSCTGHAIKKLHLRVGNTLTVQMTFWGKKKFATFLFPPSPAESSEDSKGVSLQPAKVGGGGWWLASDCNHRQEVLEQGRRTVGLSSIAVIE